MRDVDHVKGCNFGLSRGLAVGLGGFDEQLNVGAALHEETEFMLRARTHGTRIIYDGGIRLTHLAASAGGTRQRSIGQYVYALSHNRSVMTRRHSRWYQWPIAMAYSMKLISSYAVSYRQPRVVGLGLRGLRAGWRAGGAPPQVTMFAPDAPL
jgi:GT2 family glycosyltransferase